jgi:hypothetical protein
MSARTVAAAPLVDVATPELAAAFGHAACRVDHHVEPGHLLLTRDAFVARTAAWPDQWIEHHRADLPFLLPDGRRQRLPLPAPEVVRGIDDNGCWVVLWSLENEPRYEAFLVECLAGVDALAAREGGRTSSGLNLLASSPGAIVPVHFDMHHNLLLQVEGTKEVMIGSYSDPDVAQRAFDRYYDVHNNNATELPDIVSTYTLGPGDGLYIPPFGFHWVRGGTETSIGVSCGFRTRATELTNRVHRANARLRRLGLHPSPPGRSALRDRTKVTAFDWARRVRETGRAATARARAWVSSR